MRSSHTPLHPQLLSIIYYLLTDRIPSHLGSNVSLPSSPYFPSFPSYITEGSITSTVCHTPFGTWHPYTPSSGHRCIRSTSFSVTLPSAEMTSSYSTSSSLPLMSITFSLLIGCLCIATSVPGSMAFSIRCDPSSADVLRSKFVLSLGFNLACSNSFSVVLW